MRGRQTLNVTVLAMSTWLALLGAAGADYDAERDIGLVANDPTRIVAERNCALLNRALDAMWAGGAFEFTNGRAGPVLEPIHVAGKAFYFAGTIRTGKRVGGALIGMSGLGYELGDSHYAPSAGTYGGASTRFIRIDGEKGGAVLRLRGAGFRVENIQFFGRRWAHGGSEPIGIKSPSIIEVEGRNVPPSGKSLIRNCQANQADVAIRALKGYYADDGTFKELESHADLSSVENFGCQHVGTVFRSENLQAVSWSFHNIWATQGNAPLVIFDIVRGGKFGANHVWANGNKVTLLQVTDGMAPNSNRFEISDFQWDHTVAGRENYLTLFKFAGPSQNANWKKWSVRVTGHINNPHVAYDESKLIQIPADAAGFPKEDLLFDITNLPTENFIVSGPFARPK